jgi:hypothetical protein
MGDGISDINELPSWVAGTKKTLPWQFCKSDAIVPGQHRVSG